jgi:PHD/YefM family antitoxin component YafN of YafNO toxin-antitoxin module
MEGIQFVTDDKGRKTAVLIDLKKYGELWEDFYDGLIAAERADEPRESLEFVRRRLQQQEKLDG